MAKTIAFVTYETPFAPCGGIAAVLGWLPRHLKDVSPADVVVFSPYHHKSEKMRDIEPRLRLAAELNVGFEGDTKQVNVRSCDEGVRWYFFSLEDPHFFAGNRHPFDLPAEVLLRDSLFFGACVRDAVGALMKDGECILLMQDWEGATAALALAGESDKCKLHVTLHNTYDSPVMDDTLRRAGIDPSRCPGETVLQRALPLIQRPFVTVSEQFALDVTEEPFQHDIMVPHLQHLLAENMAGINNGLFEELTEDIAAQLDEMKRGSYQGFSAWKQERRRDVLERYDNLVPSEQQPVWGDLNQFERDAAPWFVLAGRDDPRQKGYDTAAVAIDRFLTAGGDARFLFFPIPGDEGVKGLEFLEVLAKKHPKSVLAFPFIYRDGFRSTLQAATFGVMPSLYEPFGMANSFYANGTVGVARATGGLVQQIVPLRSAACFTEAVAHRAARWHDEELPATGLLYREPDDLPNVVDDLRALNAAAYTIGANRVTERLQYPLFEAMAAALEQALKDSMDIWHNERGAYYRMLTAGILHIEAHFSWSKAAKEYTDLVLP